MKRLAKEFRPDWETAERLYPLILKRLEAYETFVDTQPENTPESVFEAEYQQMEQELSLLTGKDLSKIWLWEWWEADGIEVFAFDLAMPEPKTHPNLKKEDLFAFVSLIKENEFACENEFQEQFMPYMFDSEQYFFRFLELNFKNFNPNLFFRQKDKKGNYFELSAEEIVEKIWGN